MKWTIVLLVMFASQAFGESEEPTISGILDDLYGPGNWSEVSYDQLWQNPGTTSVSIVAKYAFYTHDFGYIKDDTFVVLFDSIVTHFGYLSGYDTTFTSAESGPVFRFGDDPDDPDISGGEPPLWSSLPGDNSDEQDHMRTFKVAGGSYVLAWEDMKDLGDNDFNDLVVEVSGASPVPEPATLLLLGSGLLGIGGYAGARRKKR